MSERKLVKKLANVMKEVKRIEKNGWNKFNQYKYVTETDVAEKVREVLAESNVVMIPNMTYQSVREHTNRKGHTEYIATVVMEFTFYDGDTGEEISFQVPGEGQDSGDKAIYKAITGAQKYALMKAFMIPTGDDPENDTGTNEGNYSDQASKPASDKQKKLLNDLLGQVANKYNYSNEEAAQRLKEKLNVQTEISQLNSTDTSKAIKYLQGVLKAQ